MKIAALTMVFNERHFLPLWLHHYGAVVGRENLYVVDDGSDDGSTHGLGAVKVLRAKKSLLDEEQRAARISAIQGELLTRYDAVIFSDVDELLVADPALKLSLADYIASRVDGVATATGLNVQFSRHHEAPLKGGVPLFRQRHFVQFDDAYCKTLVSRIPLRWTPGFHNCSAAPDLRSDLFLFHLRSVDPGITLDKLRSFKKITRSQRTVDLGQSAHFSYSDESYIASFYIEDRAMFEAALPPSDFDTYLIGLHKLFDVRDYKSLFAARSQLMVLPDRFADSIAIPAQFTP